MPPPARRQALDRCRRDANERDSDRLALDLGAEAPARKRRQQLGVAKTGKLRVMGQDHRARDERAGKRAASRLVDTGDETEPGVAQPALDVSVWLKHDHLRRRIQRAPDDTQDAA